MCRFQLRHVLNTTVILGRQLIYLVYLFAIKAKDSSTTLTKNLRMFTVLLFKDKPGLSVLPV